MRKPYIGVTGFMARQEVEDVLRVVPAGAKRKLMVGVLVSSKSMAGIPNSHPNRYPKPEKIAEIFIDHPDVLNLAHIYVKDADQLGEFMRKVTELAGKNFHGFQLNIKWPSPRVIYEYKKEFPGKIIVLQCGEGAMKKFGYNPARIAQMAGSYENVCDYVLIDRSMGEGKSLKPRECIEYLNNLRIYTKQVSFVVAGGLRPGKLDVIKPVIGRYPHVSIDTETGVRDENDNLIISAAQEFYLEASRLLK